MEGEANTIECKTGDLVDWADIDSLIIKYAEANHIYKPGDNVRVIDNTGDHGFIIGNTVTLLYKTNTDQINDWKVSGIYDSKLTQFILTENEEFEPIN